MREWTRSADYGKSLIKEVEPGSPCNIEKPIDSSRQTESAAVFTYTKLYSVQIKHRDRLVNVSSHMFLEADPEGMDFLDNPFLVLSEESIPELVFSHPDAGFSQMEGRYRKKSQ